MTVETEVAALTTAVNSVAASITVPLATLTALKDDAAASAVTAEGHKDTASGHASSATASASAAAATAAGIAGFDLDAIAETKGVTMVAGCISTFRMPLWLQMSTSWYRETLNTATRGARQDMPTVLVVIATASTVTLYDGDDPDLPMWMVINGSASGRFLYDGYSADITCITALNGKLIVGVKTVTDTTGNFGGGVIFDFCADKSVKLAAISSNSNYGEKAGVRAVEWGAPATYLMPPLYRLVNGMVNDVAMTILPGAPIDPRTGLAIPTIALATDGGVSVIKDDGTVVDLTHSSFGVTENVFFGADASVWHTADSDARQRFLHGTSVIPDADVALGAGTVQGLSDYFVSLVPEAKEGEQVANSAWGTNGKLKLFLSDLSSDTICDITSSYNTGWMPGDIKGAFLSDTDTASLVGSNILLNGDFSAGSSDFIVTGAGFSISDKIVASAVSANTYGPYADNATQGSSDLSKQYRLKADVVVTSGGVTLRVGNTEAITCTSTQSVDVIVSPTSNAVTIFQVRAAGSGFTGSVDNVVVEEVDRDRSVNNKGLIVNGTITRTAVATGAEKVAYSGFSASNYLEQPYNSDLDFGTGDFSIMGWVKPGVTENFGAVFSRGVYAGAWSGAGIVIDVSNIRKLRFLLTDDAFSTYDLYESPALTADVWVHFACLVQSGVARIYINGTQTTAAAVTQAAAGVSNASATTRFGVKHNGGVFAGSLALLRVSATAPTAEQSAKIYNDEKFLFQAGAQCTLYGTSDVVTALAHDDATGLLHAGTSAGRSVFSGLTRVANTTTAVTTAIAANDGLVLEQ